VRCNQPILLLVAGRKTRTQMIVPDTDSHAVMKVACHLQATTGLWMHAAFEFIKMYPLSLGVP